MRSVGAGMHGRSIRPPTGGRRGPGHNTVPTIIAPSASTGGYRITRSLSSSLVRAAANSLDDVATCTAVATVGLVVYFVPQILSYPNLRPFTDGLAIAFAVVGTSLLLNRLGHRTNRKAYRDWGTGLQCTAAAVGCFVLAHFLRGLPILPFAAIALAVGIGFAFLGVFSFVAGIGNWERGRSETIPAETADSPPTTDLPTSARASQRHLTAYELISVLIAIASLIATVAGSAASVAAVVK